MRVYHVQEMTGPDGLAMVEVQAPVPGPGEAVVAVEAVSLNARDLAITRGIYRGGGMKLPLVPCSDGAGRVAAIGPGVTRVAVGDRVAACFFPGWIDGEATDATRATALGAGGIGMLAEQVALPAEGLVKVPDHLSAEEAACLPCAGVTAWHALFGHRPLLPGQTVLVQGGGGVSMFALALARLAGARVIAVSGTAEKQKKLEALGADATVNYRDHPEWDAEILRLTGGRGVDVVVEIGGVNTLGLSLKAARLGGRVAVIGQSAGRGAGADTGPILQKSLHVHGIFVGSRAMFEALNAAVAVAGMKPVIDSVHAYKDAPDAFRRLDQGEHIGKIVISVGA